MTSRCTMTVAALLAVLSAAPARLVGPPLSLEKLTLEADIIFKGTAVSSGPVRDEWFKQSQYFIAQETHFKVISVIKGNKPGETLRLRHYDKTLSPRVGTFALQFYHFEPGRTYIVFAKEADQSGLFRQLWTDLKSREDQGVLLCPNDKLVTANTVREAFWNELTTMLDSGNPSDVTYAIRQLDQMSDGRDAFNGTEDFERKDVLEAIHGFMTDRDSKIARAAIAVVGSRNPYLSDERTPFWLATVGSAEAPGIGKMDPKMKNAGGERYWRDLLSIADGGASVETRSLAIRALGLVREPSLRKPLDRWLADPEPAVRASAALLLADFPGADGIRRMTVLADDDAADVRASVANSAGFAQEAELADILGNLLADKEAKVRKAAAMSLLSFSPKNEVIARVFRANLDNEEFEPLFLIALARENPEPYLSALAQTVEKKTEPRTWWGGQIPAFAAWEILFRYLQAQQTDKVRSGTLDRYLDAMEQVGNYSSSEPRDIYAFYLQRGMTERAKKFRDKSNKAVPYDLDSFFKMVDDNPWLYKRE